MINSGMLNGQTCDQAIETMIRYLEEHLLGVRQVEYKLRDANFSRQRYWGEPFPIYYDASGIAHDMRDDSLPHLLPELDDFKPSPDGRSPLARLTSWTNPSPDIQRETDTMPGYAGSSWYFLRYMDPHNPDRFASKDAIQYWQDVDLYIGGVEHAVGHLMYSRFWHKFLYDLGLVPTSEPYRKMVNQGMIQGIVENVVMFKEKQEGKTHFISAELIKARMIPDEQLSYLPIHIGFVTDYGQPNAYLNQEGIQSFIAWRPEFHDARFETANGTLTAGEFSNARYYTYSEIGKMSKRYHNVVNPNDVIAKYGADCFRMYEMFLGPIEQSKPWDTMGIEGVHKFLKKLSSLFYNEDGDWIVTSDDPQESSQRILHASIKKISEDIERLNLNTAVSQFMICVNELRKNSERSSIVLEPLVSMLSPFAPFLAEELWEQLGHKESVHKASFPPYDEKWLTITSITYPVCVNGKKRSELELPVGSAKDVIEAQAKSLPEIVKWIEGKVVKKVIIIPDKMINIVI
jgi:leucyl-tRNA synthetase